MRSLDPRHRAPFGQIATLLLIAFAVVAPAARGTDSDPAEQQPKDHVLFLGLDLLVDQDGAQGRLENYTSGTMHVTTPAETLRIPTGRIDTVTTVREPKVTAGEVTLKKVRAERIYTPATDPERRALREQATMMSYAAEAEQREFSAAKTAMDAEQAAASATGLAAESRRAAAVRARSNLDSVQRERTAGNYDPVRLADKTRERDDAPDSFEVSFEISSPEEIRDGFVVLLTVIRPPGDRHKPINIFAFSDLPPIGSKPRKITVRHGRLPFGVDIEDYEIHVYSAEHELATNLSRNRMEVSRSEAHQFLALQRALRHRYDDMPATVARSLLPRENRAMLSAADAQRTAEVDVDAAGQVTAVRFAQPMASEDDARLESIVRSTLFYPTLRKGRPTESTVPLTLAELIP